MPFSIHITFNGVVPRKTESSETSAPCGSEEIYAVPVSGEMAWVGVVMTVLDGTRETKTRGVSPPLIKTVVLVVS